MWLNKKDNIFVNGFDIVRNDRKDNVGGGVAILVSKSLEYKIIYNLYNCKGSIELCAIQIFLPESKLTVVFCYRSPTNNITETSWLRFLTQFEEKFIVVGDFNTHHPYWGNRVRCEEGKKLFNAIEGSEVGISNEGSSTYYSRQYGTESAIDLAFVDNTSLASYNWSVGRDSWGSDHYPIFITLNERTEQKTYFKLTRLVNCKTDWNLVVENLKKYVKQCAEIINNNRINTQVKYKTFLAIITNCIEETNPRKNFNRSENNSKQKTKINTPNTAPWWNK